MCEQKANHLLGLFSSWEDPDFVDNVVAGDEMRVFEYDSEQATGIRTKNPSYPYAPWRPNQQQMEQGGSASYL